MKLRFKTYNHENVKQDQDKTMFFDESVAIARYDVQKYPFFEKMTDRHLGFFWRPDEIDVTRDAKDFKELTDFELVGVLCEEKLKLIHDLQQLASEILYEAREQKEQGWNSDGMEQIIEKIIELDLTPEITAEAKELA